MAKMSIEALSDLADRPFGRQSPLPNWACNFQTADEVATLQKITELKSEMEDLKKRIELQQRAFLQSEELKHLIAGSGDDFKNAVASALTALGLKVVDGPRGRADLLATNGKRLFAIETNGLDGCAKESNVTQASRWAADVDSALWLPADEREPELLDYVDQIAKLDFEMDDNPDRCCKGISVIGTFREIPLDQRTERDFPDPVMRVLNRSRVCAVTGLELFAICVRSRNYAELRSGFQEALFNTNGVLQMSDGWLSFLASESEQDSSDF